MNIINIVIILSVSKLALHFKLVTSTTIVGVKNIHVDNLTHFFCNF